MEINEIRNTMTKFMGPVWVLIGEKLQAYNIVKIIHMNDNYIWKLVMENTHALEILKEEMDND